MKTSSKIAVGIVAGLGLSLAVAGVYAHPGQRGGGMGPGGMAGMQQGMGPGGMGGMHQGMGRGMGPGAGQAGAAVTGHQLMTAEEWTAQREKMRSAASVEERQKLAAEHRTEMQKRAAEKGITLPEPRGPRAGYGRNLAPAPAAR